jgi:hypothetical protein
MRSLAFSASLRDHQLAGWSAGQFLVLEASCNGEEKFVIGGGLFSANRQNSCML